MLHVLGSRLRHDQGGFTLIELLVVILIIGILAAIAIPAFLGQRQKSQDAAAKSAVRNAGSAAEAYASDKGGDYTGMDLTALKSVEASLNDTSATDGSVAVNGVSSTGYTLSSKSKSGTFFNLTRSNGNSYRCKGASASTACTSSSASTW